jgi:nucleolar protein 12
VTAPAKSKQAVRRRTGDKSFKEDALPHTSSDDETNEDGDNSDEATSPEPAQVTDGAAIHAVNALRSSQRPNEDRKRKRRGDDDDLEAKYLAKLNKNEENEDEEDSVTKRQKTEDAASATSSDNSTTDAGGSETSSDDDAIPVHESLAQDTIKGQNTNDNLNEHDELEKAAGTVFLSNVSTEAISSKSAKKILLDHLSSVLESTATPPQKLISIRFRSVPFSTNALPKRAAYIRHAVMDATTKSANAYAVYSSAAAARTAASKLNGTEVLGRHIRVDSVTHPSPVDHRRCIFVGNLGFVDDEMVLNTNSEGETTQRKRRKMPADAEEGLWRTFGTVGRVESVRVVRDSKTRVGKGFAYVQFYVSRYAPMNMYLINPGLGRERRRGSSPSGREVFHPNAA